MTNSFLRLQVFAIRNYQQKFEKFERFANARKKT